MSLRPNRPAPLPPEKPRSGYKTFDPYLKNDNNNNKNLQLNSTNRPTVIRPSAKKKPPPRPAPPRNSLIRKNAIKRPKSVTSATPDLLADLQDIFGPSKPSPFGSPATNRSTLKKNRAPQPQWPKKPNEGSLIDFDAPSGIIRQSSSTPSFGPVANRTLLDEDLPFTPSTTSASSGSLQDLLTLDLTARDGNQFGNSFRSDATRYNVFSTSMFGGRQTSAQGDSIHRYWQPVTSQHGGLKSTQYNHDPFEAKVSTTKDNPFGSSIKTSSTLLDSVFNSNFKKESSSPCTEQWGIDQFSSPPEPQHPPPPPPPEASLDTEKWCRALFDFAAQSPDELGFTSGDIILLEEAVSADWWKGQFNGKSGLFPSNYVELAAADETTSFSSSSDQGQSSDPCTSQNSSCCYATALYTFETEQDGDLGFKEGDVIQVLYRINQDWLYGKFMNKEGQFPANFVQKLSSEENENKMEVIAGYAFHGDKKDELTFGEGEVIIVVEKVNSDWSKGYLKNDKKCTVGYFPTAFTSPMYS